MQKLRVVRVIASNWGRTPNTPGHHLTAESGRTTPNVTSRLLALWLLSLLLVLWPRVSNSAQREQRGFVAKTRTQTLFVFGSTHLSTSKSGRDPAVALSPCFKSVAVEFEDSRAWGKALVDGLPRPTLLSGNVLSEPEIARISALLSKRFNRNVSPNDVAVVPAVAIYYTLLGLPLLPSGSRVGIEPPLEVSFSEIARREGLRVRPISHGEDHGQVLGSLKASDWTTIINGLLSAISNAPSNDQNFSKEIEMLARLNFVGDFEAVFELADKIQKRKFSNPFGASLLQLPHAHWVRRLKDLGDGAHVVVLGTNHLGGKTGIKNLLLQAGYEIRSTTIADANCVK